MAESLLRIMVALDPLCLSSEGSAHQSPVLTNTLKSIQNFSYDTLKNSTGKHLFSV